MSTRKNPCYFLGTIVNGGVYAYTALGLFKSARQAAERCQEKGALVFEQYECWSHGINYGLTAPVVVARCLGASK